MGPSNLLLNVFEHCEMTSQVPKRMVVVFGRGASKYPFPQNLTFSQVWGIDLEQVGQLHE